MRISDWSSDVCSSDLYARKVPYLVVTGAKVRTTFTPDLPAVSDLQLDMGIRIPVLRDWPGNKPVNGQAAYTSHVVELPVRNDDGSLRIVPALLPRTADVSADYLPLTQIGRAQVWTPVTNAHLVCRLLLEKTKHNDKN